jgi:hypothetical protein
VETSAPTDSRAHLLVPFIPQLPRADHFEDFGRREALNVELAFEDGRVGALAVLLGTGGHLLLAVVDDGSTTMLQSALPMARLAAMEVLEC